MNEYQMHHFQDCWSIWYMHLGRSLLDAFGVDGEQILRESVRQFGRDRGLTLRKKHLDCGLKPNLYNMFNYYDLPLNTQYRQNKVRSTETERLTHTRGCPIADLWKANGELDMGRMYCEEFHHAMFGAYNSHTQINLAQTLTMEGIDYHASPPTCVPATCPPRSERPPSPPTTPITSCRRTSSSTSVWASGTR